MENNSSIFILKNIEDWYLLGSRNDFVKWGRLR